MITLTLDTNCLIDLDATEENRPQARFVRELLDHHRNGRVDIALGASSASELQGHEKYLQNSQIFRSRASALGFEGVRLLPPLMRWDIGFWDESIWSGPELAEREREVFSVLFPNSFLEWAEFAHDSRCDPKDETTPEYRRWRNRLLDAQAFWAHEYAQRDIFVTSDRNFKKLIGHEKFPLARVLLPEEAVDAIAEQDRGAS